MGIITKIGHKLDKIYKQKIVCEQYPMLSSLSRNKLQAEGAIGMVYMLHHIANKDPRLIPTNEDLKVSPKFLEEIIGKYRAKGFDFLSLDQLYDILISGDTPNRPFVIFTIDDGYLDNYTHAFPVFEQFKIPFAIFISTDFIDKKAILWWDSIEELIMTHDSVVTADNRRYPCKTFQQRWDAFRFLRERILNLDQNNLLTELNMMFGNYRIDWLEPIRQKGMSWSQVIELANHPLCTIGGHTISHPSLKQLCSDEARHEIVEGKRMLERAIRQPVNYFAYPYGTPNEVGEREFQIINDLKIKLAFCAHGGCITKKEEIQLSRLPRVYLHEK